MKENNIEVSDKVEMRPINTIKPYIRNPRVNDRTVDELVKIIPKVGFNVPLVIDEKGIIVKGHARFKAAIKLGMKELPCIVTHASEDAIRADRITDNRISELSEWVNEELMHEVDMIDLDIDFDDLGLPRPSFEDMPTEEQFEEELEEEPDVTPEQKQKLYEEFLEKQAKEQAPKVQMTTQSAIEAAERRQMQTADKPPKYYKVVCEKCGHTMFVNADDVWSPENGKDYSGRPAGADL